MELRRKYGVQTDLYFPMVKRSVQDFAVSADWTPAAGDVTISKDGGTAANTTNLPTAITMGNGAMWKLTLTATEMSAAKISISIVDAATKAVEDQFMLLATYGNASAETPFDLSSAAVTVGTNNDKSGYDLSASGANATADALLKRDWTAVSGEAGRSVLNALRFLRNKWTITGSALSVKKEDDSTEAYAQTLSTDSSAIPVTGQTPS